MLKLQCPRYLAERQPFHGNSETRLNARHPVVKSKCIMKPDLTMHASVICEASVMFYVYSCRIAAISSILPHPLNLPMLRDSRRSQTPSSSVGSVCGIVAEEENVGDIPKCK